MLRNLPYFPDLKLVICSKSYRGDAGGFKVYNFCYFEKNRNFKFFTKVLLLDPLNLDDHISQTSIYVHLAKLTEPTLYIKTCLYTCGIIHYISTGGCRGTLRLTVSFQDLEKTLRLKGI